MRGIVTGRLAAVAVSAALLLPPGAYADAPDAAPEPAHERSVIPTSEEILSGVAVVVDVLIVRPAGATATAIGFGLFLPAALLSMADYPDNVREAWDVLVMTPARTVYDRPLGDL